MRKYFMLSLLFFVVLAPSCRKKVPDTPIYINMDRFASVDYAKDFKDKLQDKLKKYGFNIVEDVKAPYRIDVDTFFVVSESYQIQPLGNDCYNRDYTLSRYHYGLNIFLKTANNNQLGHWEETLTKEEALQEGDYEENCTNYTVVANFKRPDDYFVKQATNIAKSVLRIVREDL